MHALPPVPSPLLKLASAVARWSLVLMLSAWFILAAVWCALHWIIVPRIGDFRAQVETRATAALGMPVKIGALRAGSGGLMPSIELSDVKLMDGEGREALVLGRVVVALSPQSVLRLSLDQLYIESPQLDVRRRADGRFVVAGLVLAGADSQDDSRVADWLFSQKEVVIKNGLLRWTDEKHPQPPLVTHQVDLVLRNGFRSHDLRIDATPEPRLGDRFTLMGKFQQPLLSLRSSYWQDWTGQIYAAFDRVDVAQLSLYATPGMNVGRGNGALRAWVDIQGGKAAKAVADVALVDVSTRVGTQTQALDFHAVSGRVGGQRKPDGFEFHTEGLMLQAQVGKPWPSGNFKIEQTGKSFQFEADQVDLALLAQLADRLPLGDEVHAKLVALNPKGVVDSLRASWSGALDAPEKYAVAGKVKGLSLSSSGARLPGLAGLSASFAANEGGGKASLDLANGAIDLPGFLDAPHVALAALTGDVEWKVQGQNIAVQSSNLKFSNQDAQGAAQLKWQTSVPNSAQGRGRFPGVLDLQATFNRIQGVSVHRYLPSAMLPTVRDYVRDAVLKGSASDVKLRIKGDIYDLPFRSEKQGEFRISAKVSDLSFAFVPPSLLPAGGLPWPELTQVNADFLLDRLQLQVKSASGRLGGKLGAAPLQISKADAQIPDLLNSPTVLISAEAKGALATMLAVVNESPLRDMTGASLSAATASGVGDLRLKLNLPLFALERATVQGSVTLTDSDIQMSAGAPPVTRSRGIVNFSERGFHLPNLQGRMFGGDVAIQGGSPNFTRADASAAASGPTGPAGASALLNGVVLQAQGSLSAQALRQAKDLGLVSRLAQQASGVADYAAVLSFGQGPPEILLTSTLAGMAVTLPPPFAKLAETTLPLRVQISNRPDKAAADQIQIDIAKVAGFTYVRDVSGETAKVLAGSIAVGLAANESAPLPVEGVVANVNLPIIDVDAWTQVFSQASGTVPDGAQGTGGAPSTLNSSNPAMAYLPSIVAVRAGELSVAGRKFRQVVVGASREGRTWRANMDSTELNGYAEYRQAVGQGAGRVYARLARLTLASSSAKEVESLLEEQPASVPALDIVVDDLELRGKKLGRVEVEAVNRVSGSAREWRLAKFNVLLPEGAFTATGNWATLNAQGLTTTQGADKSTPERRRTVMNFKLDIEDSGLMLARFGMNDVIRRGKGKLEGQVSWVGSPLALDYPTLGGAFTVNVESGQFLKADPGIAKLLGVLSLQSLPRRLALDFRDVFTEGFSFDFVRGDIKIEQGIATTNNLQMKGVNAAVLMEGRADIAKETQDLRVVVVPEINAGTASLIATVINPAIGLGTFLAQLILRRPLIESATQEFHIDGSWLDPKVTRVPHRSDRVIEPNSQGPQ